MHSDDFNPRSREGSDNQKAVQEPQHTNFNPRSREGSDGIFCCSIRLSSISIHAPARGATYAYSHGDERTYFNPRSREGSDHTLCRSAYYLSYFNPRSREGSDFIFEPVSREAYISIHAPARGATVLRKCLIQLKL